MSEHQHINGKLTDFLMEFAEVKNQVEEIHNKVGGDGGIKEQVTTMQEHTRHLEQLPLIAQTMKANTRNHTLSLIIFTLFILVMLIKGTNLKISIPGWLEINGNQQP